MADMADKCWWFSQGFTSWSRVRQVPPFHASAKVSCRLVRHPPKTRGRHLQLGLRSTSHFRYSKWYDFRLSISLVELFNWYSSNWGQWFRFYSCWEHETSHGRRSLSYCLAMLWLLEMHLRPGSQEWMLCWGTVHRLAWLKNCGPTLTTKKNMWVSGVQNVTHTTYSDKARSS